MAFQKALHRVRPLGGMDPRYLRYLLEHLSLRGALASWATGSTIKHLPQEQLRQLPIPLPPLAEQRRIVVALERHLPRLEAALTQASTIVRRSTSWETAISGAIVGGRWSQLTRPDGGPASWGEASIDDLASVGTGATPSRSRKEFYEGGPCRGLPAVFQRAIRGPCIGIHN
ncbi:hypothetical protein GCM10027614_25300 [Micromonospora vulcania]